MEKTIGQIKINLPENLAIDNTNIPITITNNHEEEVEIKLYLEADTTTNVNNYWYTIEPQSLTISAKGSKTSELTINAPPIDNSTQSDLEEVVKLKMQQGQQDVVVRKYILTIPPQAQTQKPVISLQELAEQVKQLSANLPKEKINQLETKVIQYQAEIIQLEQTLNTKIKTLETTLHLSNTKIDNLEIALQEERRKLQALQEEEEKKRRLTENLGSGGILELVEIPGGKFLMGGVREITLQGFLMGKYPVTQGQWEAIMGNNPSHFKANNRPVEQVNWHEANEFCQKLSQRTGRKYQLPTESQWEYACRAKTTTNYFFGDDEKDLEKYAWYDKNSNNTTQLVGEKLPNPWGLYDIVGNVWEWCQDDWKGDQSGYKNIQIDHIPTNGSAFENNSDIKCLRGGAWNYNPDNCRSDYRGGGGPTGRHKHVGLRVVMLPLNPPTP